VGNKDSSEKEEILIHPDKIADGVFYAFKQGKKVGRCEGLIMQNIEYFLATSDTRYLAEIDWE